MNHNPFDLFVIGAGSGGVRAARMAAGFGARVAIAEERYLGGTCVNVGCVPKKLLLMAANCSEQLTSAEHYGWSITNDGFNWPLLIDNKNREIERLNGIYERLLTDAGVELIDGRATVIDRHTVRVGDQHYRTEKILIATGGWPTIPDFPGNQHVINSNQAFFLQQLPERIIIVGGGYIAVEFASIFNGMGVDTTLLYRGPLFLRGFDLELRQHLAQEMSKRGVKIEFECNITAVEPYDSGYRATLTSGKTLDAGQIMYATGRCPNTTGLGLEAVGVALDSKGAIVVNEQYQTTVPSIYALGDVTNRVNLTPVALAEGMALARSLYGGDAAEPVDYRGIASCIFSLPNAATVGLTEEEAGMQYDQVAIYQSSFTPMKHTLTGSSEKTFIKLIVDQTTDRVVGAHMVGPDAGEIIQGIAIALKAGATKRQFDTTIGIHPTLAEEFVTLRDPGRQGAVRE